MGLLRALLYFIVLEMITIMVWFLLAVNIKTVINYMVSAVNMPRVTEVGQNVINGINAIFIVLVLGWLVWLVVMVHLITHETAYQSYPSHNQIRKW